MRVTYSLDPVSMNNCWHFVVSLLHLDLCYTVVYLMNLECGRTLMWLHCTIRMKCV